MPSNLALAYPRDALTHIVLPMEPPAAETKSLGDRVQESIGDHNPALIAKRAGVSAAWLSQLVGGSIAEPSAFRLYRLAKVLDEDYEYLLTGRYESEPTTPDEMERWMHRVHREHVRHMTRILAAQQAIMAKPQAAPALSPEAEAWAAQARADTQSAQDRAAPPTPSPAPAGSAAAKRP